jgi:hypothetical protein
MDEVFVMARNRALMETRSVTVTLEIKLFKNLNSCGLYKV